MARRVGVVAWPSAATSEEEIAQRQRLLQQDVLRNTELALKEHFVLKKIAETEKIDISEDDLVEEIDRLAEQSEESPRRCGRRSGEGRPDRRPGGRDDRACARDLDPGQAGEYDDRPMTGRKTPRR